MSRPKLEEPIEISKFWKNRRRNESVHVTLSEYEGHCLINVRTYATGTDGIDRPTPKGVAMGIRKLPELAAAVTKALAKAKELGLLDDEAGE
jgi:Transcriptional Coactivator p15 (PC4)